MREECEKERPSDRSFGITPAHAGRIRAGVGAGGGAEDHPRACGKNAACAWLTWHKLGSPPRMREECNAGRDAAAVTGITPAHAGRIRIVKGH